MPNSGTNKSSVQVSIFRIRLFHILILTGLVFILVPTVFYLNEYFQLSFETPIVRPIIQKEKITYSLPSSVSIPAVGMRLPVTETEIVNNVWQIAPNSASYLETSARPGQNGPVILYAHNTNNRFGPIRWLSVGEKISIQTQDKKIHTYSIIKTEEVSPENLSTLLDVRGETLIMYTCSGFADLKRFLVFAVPTTS